MAVYKNWADIWGPGVHLVGDGDIWADIWALEGEGAVITPGDLVQVLTAGGIPCSVAIDAGTPVRVVISSAIQITVFIEGGTVIHVTI